MSRIERVNQDEIETCRQIVLNALDTVENDRCCSDEEIAEVEAEKVRIEVVFNFALEALSRIEAAEADAAEGRRLVTAYIDRMPPGLIRWASAKSGRGESKT